MLSAQRDDGRGFLSGASGTSFWWSVLEEALRWNHISFYPLGLLVWERQLLGSIPLKMVIAGRNKLRY